MPPEIAGDVDVVAESLLQRIRAAPVPTYVYLRRLLAAGLLQTHPLGVRLRMITKAWDRIPWGERGQALARAQDALGRDAKGVHLEELSEPLLEAEPPMVHTRPPAMERKMTAATPPSVRPITPEEVLSGVPPPGPVPEFVFEAVNFLLKTRFRGHPLELSYADIANAIQNHTPIPFSHKNMPQSWLAFDKAYYDAGWIVTRSRGVHTDCIVFSKPTPLLGQPK